MQEERGRGYARRLILEVLRYEDGHWSLIFSSCKAKFKDQICKPLEGIDLWSFTPESSIASTRRRSWWRTRRVPCSSSTRGQFLKMSEEWVKLNGGWRNKINDLPTHTGTAQLPYTVERSILGQPGWRMHSCTRAVWKNLTVSRFTMFSRRLETASEYCEMRDQLNFCTALACTLSLIDRNIF